MLKERHSTGEQQKRRLQVALDLPPEVERQIRQGATSGFRSISKEIAMRLVQGAKSSNQGAQA